MLLHLLIVGRRHSLRRLS